MTRLYPPIAELLSVNKCHISFLNKLQFISSWRYTAWGAPRGVIKITWTTVPKSVLLGRIRAVGKIKAYYNYHKPIR